MGETHSLLAPFFVDEVGAAAEFVRRTIGVLRENGFETTRNGGDEVVEMYDTGRGRRSDADAPLEAVVDEIVAAGGGTIRVWLDGYGMRVEFDFDAADGREGESENETGMRVPLTLSGPKEYAFEEGDVSRDTARDRADRVVDAIADLAVETDPWLVAGWVYYAPEDPHPFPEGRPPSSGIDRLGWVTVFDSTWNDRFGGRDRLLEAPAWNVRDLGDAVLVREHDVPHAVRSDAETGPEPSTYEYLFERRSLEDLRTEIERQRNTYVDPFRDLEDGELVSDVVLCEAHAPFEFDRMDYAAFPDDLGAADRCQVLCVRRDGDKLWAADNDEFVRRLVDETGRPVGDLPDGVAPDQEMISLAVRSEYRGRPSLDMYRMDGPDDPSLAARLYGLNRPAADQSIWQDRDDPVARQRE